MTDTLAALLADTHALALKTQNYHWNVRGPRFFDLHAQFEAQYTELNTAVDLIAERIRALGALAPGGYAAFSRLTSIKDGDGSLSADEMIRDLADSHTTAADTARRAFTAASQSGDDVTAGIALDRLSAHDKAKWMLTAQLG